MASTTSRGLKLSGVSRHHITWSHHTCGHCHTYPLSPHAGTGFAARLPSPQRWDRQGMPVVIIAIPIYFHHMQGLDLLPAYPLHKDETGRSTSLVVAACRMFTICSVLVCCLLTIRVQTKEVPTCQWRCCHNRLELCVSAHEFTLYVSAHEFTLYVSAHEFTLYVSAHKFTLYVSGHEFTLYV